MNRDGVNGVLMMLLQLLSQNEWEARHGGLLGLKYLLAVREVTYCIIKEKGLNRGQTESL